MRQRDGLEWFVFVDESFSVQLEDGELLLELGLLTDLIIAVNEHPGPLSPETVDRLLGI